MLYSTFLPTIIFENSVQLVGCVLQRPVFKGHPAMSKRDFDCSSFDSSPSDTEGAQAAQDTEDDDDDLNSFESDSEEDEPSIPSTSPSRSQKIALTVSGFFASARRLWVWCVARCLPLVYSSLKMWPCRSENLILEY